MGLSKVKAGSVLYIKQLWYEGIVASSTGSTNCSRLYLSSIPLCHMVINAC